ncbi:fungal-specific transcription factor domain-containing protein [Mycena latifolia]|nr:fungal-specific transcription factor domain-containing protein [Mycena latifolia]
MPVAPKSPQTKKPGPPKAKGAVRAKSGCYTCRIRRKKCDERANQDGHCETCVRLRLQCLGFGAKRPEWLRVGLFVASIGPDLTSRFGMIKGHSGSGPRGSEHDLPVLKLEEDNTPSSSESPPTPTLSLSPSEAPRTLQHESAIREQRTSWIGVDYPHSLHQMRGSSPFGGSSQSSHHDGMPHHDMYSNSYNSPNSIVPWIAPRSPALGSSFSTTYHTVYEDDMYGGMPLDDEDMAVVLPGPYIYMKPGGGSDQLVNYYLGNVMNLQYLLADSNQIRYVLFPSVTKLGASRNAARLLAAIHTQRATYRSDNYIALQDPEAKDKYDELQMVLKKQPQDFTEDDALAAISIISSFLFDGGAGPWQDWLKLSYTYADSVFRDRDPRDTLQHCGETTRFIIKTAIWFDVLAAITTQEAPRFLHYIRQLYSPEASVILDPSLPPPDELSMMNVMGCENHIVWAMAEASALAVWKQDQMARGCLSMPELVARASNLDQNYLKPTAPELRYGATETEVARELSSNIFRAATRVYLRAIVSGDFPHVPEIGEAIDETMSFARAPQAQGSQKVHSSVVRSTVFAFFICGALTDSTRIRNEVFRKLSLEGEDVATSTVGNSASIKRLLQSVWNERAKRPLHAAVPWRDVLRKSNMLLV